ncbi:hypothetical protein glysoja_047935 [Glycine soja]|uniref:Uncharacterized protein n=1 Tax=Glycine soja TaxID=3848 RepID=A0A0B2P280_GLYSO|nr:hypothetical protein glysoja_047935 [Glycine soja]
MQAIKKETSGNFESALLTILRCATDPAMYFAKVLIISGGQFKSCTAMIRIQCLSVLVAV